MSIDTASLALAWTVAVVGIVSAYHYRSRLLGADVALEAALSMVDQERKAREADRAEREQQSPLRSGELVGRRVMITDDSDRAGYGGVLAAAYFRPDGELETVILHHGSEWKKNPQGRLESVQVPGEVLIPGRKIRVVQVVGDDD